MKVWLYSTIEKNSRPLVDISGTKNFIPHKYLIISFLYITHVFTML